MVCGGGSRNPLLMARLAALLPGTEVTTTDAVGISGDDMEALAFAWLAWRTLAGLPGNLPSVTGASQETVLGAIFPAKLGIASCFFRFLAYVCTIHSGKAGFFPV